MNTAQVGSAWRAMATYDAWSPLWNGTCSQVRRAPQSLLPLIMFFRMAESTLGLSEGLSLTHRDSGGTVWGVGWA